MARPNNTILLSEALRQAFIRNWPTTPIRRAVERGVIPSWRSSERKGARYYVLWSDVAKYMDDLKVVA